MLSIPAQPAAVNGSALAWLHCCQPKAECCQAIRHALANHSSTQLTTSAVQNWAVHNACSQYVMLALQWAAMQSAHHLCVAQATHPVIRLSQQLLDPHLQGRRTAVSNTSGSIRNAAWLAASWQWAEVVLAGDASVALRTDLQLVRCRTACTRDPLPISSVLPQGVPSCIGETVRWKLGAVAAASCRATALLPAPRASSRPGTRYVVCDKVLA